MKTFVVIDTNVIVSALLSKYKESATVKVFNAFLRRGITMLYNEEILQEYRHVLMRPKFKFPLQNVLDILNFIEHEGVPSNRVHSEEFFPDPKDIVFYEVALSHKDTFLVTGNTKHFPKTPLVVTPTEMVAILENKD